MPQLKCVCDCATKGASPLGGDAASGRAGVTERGMSDERALGAENMDMDLGNELSSAYTVR